MGVCGREMETITILLTYLSSFGFVDCLLPTIEAQEGGFNSPFVSPVSRLDIKGEDICQTDPAVLLVLY